MDEHLGGRDRRGQHVPQQFKSQFGPKTNRVHSTRLYEQFRLETCSYKQTVQYSESAKPVQKKKRQSCKHIRFKPLVKQALSARRWRINSLETAREKVQFSRCDWVSFTHTFINHGHDVSVSPALHNGLKEYVWKVKVTGHAIFQLPVVTFLSACFDAKTNGFEPCMKKLNL